MKAQPTSPSPSTTTSAVIRRPARVTGSALLAQVADKTGLTRALSRELAALQKRAGSHDRGRVIRDLAVMLADGGDRLAALGAVRDQAVLCHADV